MSEGQLIRLLLCASHIANTYILLSANVEDIKKVASKFLSSDIVQQLTNVINKFKTDTNINLSEENKVNEKTINKISDDEIEERAPIRKPTKKTTKDVKEQRNRYKNAELMNKISQELEERPNYKLYKDEIDERAPRYKTTRRALREREVTNANRQKKDRERDGELYWNDDEDVQRVERVIATSGRLKLPEVNRGRQHTYNWEISSDN